MSTKLSRYCDGVMEAAWIAAVVVIPLFFNIYSSRIFEPDKISILRTLALIILAAWIIKLIEERGIRWEKIEFKGSLLSTLSTIPIIVPVIALASVYLIATIFSVTPRISLVGSYQRLQGTYTYFSYLVIFASIVGNLRKRSQVDRLVTTVILTSLPIGLYGILQKYEIDPVPWGGNVSNRIASNMGNSIFVAAYLIMAVPITIGRIIDSFEKILNEDERLGSHVLRATIYVFIVAVQLIAIYMSGSRGPLLGLLAGLFFMLILLSVFWRKRWLTITAVGIAGLMGAFLIVLNIPNGPLEFIRQAPGVGRFGQVLDMEQRTSQVRILIWQGAAELVLPHEPLIFPDETTDSYNILRPILGYGPESMYVAYNQFYPPDLGRVEKRNASPDRSHNETWDSLVTTGILGLIAYLVLFISIFYFGLKWVGLIRSDKNRNLFISFLALGGIIGGVGLSIWQGIGFLGVGIPFGLLVGLIAYLAITALISSEVYAYDEFNRPHVLVLIMLLGAVVAHFAEINFGIAIVATRTHFWLYTGLLLTVGYILPLYGEVESLQEDVQVNDSSLKEANSGNSKRSRKFRRRRARSSPPIVGTQVAWRRTAFVGALITSVILVTIGYDFISNPNSSTSIIRIIVSSITRLPNNGDAVSFGILALVLTTWFSALIVFTSESKESTDSNDWIRTFLTMLGLSFIIIIVFWIWHAGTLANLSKFEVTNQFEVLDQIGRIGGLLNRYYIYLFFLLSIVALFLPEDWSSRAGVSPIGSVMAPAALIILIVATYYTNVRVIQADIAFKMAEPFVNSDQWPVTTYIYRRALELTPNEDHYYLFLGKSYLEQAKNVETDEDQDLFVNQSENDLKVAQNINPLNTDHTANLGRLYSWWAGRATENQIRNQRGEVASDYYRKAVKLSPNNPNLWNEWAILQMDILRNSDLAYERLTYSLSLDNLYSWTHSLLGDYYLRIARASENDLEKKESYQKAIEHYSKAVEVATNKENQAKVGYLVSLGNGYIELASNYPDEKAEYLRPATEAYLLAIDTGPRKNDLWRIEETLSRLYAQLGDKASALIHANAALAAAPNNQKENLHTLISQIQTLP